MPLVVVFAAVAVSAAPASALPTILVASTAGEDIDQRLEERPATISYTEDNSRQVAGSYNGPAPSAGPDLGPLEWTIYSDEQAQAAGIAYVPDCTRTTCEGAPFRPVPATVRAHAPEEGHFTRLTIRYTYRGRTLVERTRIHRYPADGEGRRAHWGYMITPHRYEKCGTVRYHPDQLGRPTRGVVRTNPDVASCRTARRVARKATKKVAEIGNPLPAPAGWGCNGGFRPTFDNPRPSTIGCYRRGRAATFERIFNPTFQVAVR